MKGSERYHEIGWNVEFPEFPNDSWHTPGRVGERHPVNQALHLLGHCRSSWLSMPAQPRPVLSKAFPLPSNDGAGLDEHYGLAPIWPDA
jgi:hypothetical protein